MNTSKDNCISEFITYMDDTPIKDQCFIIRSMKFLKHKQQRLLILRHSYVCAYCNTICPITPHCHLMKQLWKHMNHCVNNECSIPHCISSRMVLMHFKRCTMRSCLICRPVRYMIRQKNCTRNKQVVGMLGIKGHTFNAFGSE